MATSLPWPVHVFLIASGLLIIALGVPLARRRVRPNPFYGVRLAATMADEQVWYDINARGGRHIIAIGIAYLGFALAGFAFGQSWPIGVRAVGPIALLTVFLVVDTIVLARAANRALAARRASGPGRVG